MDRQERVGVLQILLSLVELNEEISNIFYDLGINYNQVVNVVAWIDLKRKFQQRWHHMRKRSINKPKKYMNRAMTARETRVLNSFSHDLTLAARVGSFMPLVGRQKEMQEILRILKETTGNVLLIGEAGVGKTSMIEGVADAMAAEEVPEKFQDKRLVSLNTGALVAGASETGELEWRMMEIIKEVAMSANILLVIEDIHNLVGTASVGKTQDLATIIADFLSKGAFQIIATTTPSQFNKHLSSRETFLSRFQKVDIKEVEPDDAIKILEIRSGAFEAQYNVFFTYHAIAEAVDLTSRYIQDRFLPAKAIDIISEAAVFAKEKKGEKSLVTKEDVRKIMTEKTNVQVTEVTEEESKKLLRLESIIHQRMVDQEEAVSSVSEALRRSRAKIRDESRPISSFLFLGPTGVGKTELAKTVAEVYFGDEKKMIRLDMSEYQDQTSIHKLIGRPGGDELSAKGLLTEAVIKTPFSLILLDELEKAHKEILNAFLQVLEDGRLTDAAGKTVDFSNTIIIATSNACTKLIQERIKQKIGVDKIKEEMLQKDLLEFFRPEFINRFDDVVVFKPLSIEEVFEIAKLMLKKVALDIESKHGITFRASENAIKELAEAGFDPLYGARPLRRLLQNKVDNALAKLLLQEKLDKRDIVVLENMDEMKIQKVNRT